jgi:hypothetical protein
LGAAPVQPSGGAFGVRFGKEGLGLPPVGVGEERLAARFPYYFPSQVRPTASQCGPPSSAVEVETGAKIPFPRQILRATLRRVGARDRDEQPRPYFRIDASVVDARLDASLLPGCGDRDA